MAKNKDESGNLEVVVVLNLIWFFALLPVVGGAFADYDAWRSVVLPTIPWWFWGVTITVFWFDIKWAVGRYYG